MCNIMLRIDLNFVLTLMAILLYLLYYCCSGNWFLFRASFEFMTSPPQSYERLFIPYNVLLT